MGDRTDLQTLLTDAREAAGLSQNRAAAKANVTRKTWGWWEAGKSVPYKGMLLAITTTLGLEPGSLDEAHAQAVSHRQSQLADEAANGAPA